MIFSGRILEEREEEMKGYVQLKDEYLKRSKERVPELGSGIERLGERFPSPLKAIEAKELSSLMDGLRKGSNGISMNWAMPVRVPGIGRWRSKRTDRFGRRFACESRAQENFWKLNPKKKVR